MKKSKFSAEQVAYTIRPSEGGTAVAYVCRQLRIREATFHVWKKGYAHLGVNEIRQRSQLEDKNSRLKLLVADLTPDEHVLAEALRTNA